MKIDKYCKRCDLTLPIGAFSVASKRYDGVQAYCVECMKKYRIEYYQRNKASHVERNYKSRAKLRDYVLALKAAPCKDCGVCYPAEPWLMEFDHREPDKKTNSIFYFVTSGSMRLLKEEVAKCDLVCVVCHRRRTAEYFGWLDNRLAHLLQ